MKKRMYVLLAVLVAFAMVFTACSAQQEPAQSSSAQTPAASQSQAQSASESSAPVSDETYVWACQYNTLPLFVNNDYVGFEAAAKELGVKTKIIGPQNIDLPAFIAAMEQEIPNKPAGMMVVCWDDSLADPVNKCVEAGIPVATTDGDLPNSKRQICTSVNWHDMGVSMATELGKYLKDKQGKVVQIGIPGNAFQRELHRGVVDTLATLAPGVQVVEQIYESKSNSQEVTKTASNLITSMPDLVGFVGSDSSSGPGIGQALKEANKVGQIFGVCVDAEAEQLKCVQEGSLVAAFCQKRKLGTYYGLKMLYDYHHTPIKFTSDDAALGISQIPLSVSVGTITITPDIVEKYIATLASGAGESTKPASDETYVWACQYNTLPLFVNNDYVGFEAAAKELGVKTKIIGPQNIDLPAFIAAMEQEIPNKPAGMMVVCWDDSLADPVNKCVEAGIPVATTDGDLPNSKRQICTSVNWHDMGVSMATELGKYLKDKQGKVVQIGIPGNAFQRELHRGVVDTLATLAPGVQVVEQIYESKSNSQEVTKTASNLITSMPDLVGFVGSDSSSGPGIGQALKEANKVGQIFGVCVDAEAEQLKCVQEGSLVAAFCQKRKLGTYYGLKMLYDYHHTPIKFTSDDAALGISQIPLSVSVGTITITPENVEQYIKTKQ